jgi:tetratricopeptide (TPR) repeat protein
MLEVDSLLSLGLYNIDLWELDSAADLFQQVIDLAYNTQHHSWAEKASLGLALVNSYSNTIDTIDPAVDRLYRAIVEEDKTYNTGRFAYFIQILGQILFNHRQLEPARIIWQRAIAFSQSSHYLQIKAKCLIGLGKIERQAAKFDLAIAYHQQAVFLLEKIAAKCDLAEAYLQQGLTLQAVGRVVESKSCFARAIAVSPSSVILQNKNFNTLSS